LSFRPPALGREAVLHDCLSLRQPAGRSARPPRSWRRGERRRGFFVTHSLCTFTVQSHLVLVLSDQPEGWLSAGVLRAVLLEAVLNLPGADAQHFGRP